MTDAVSDLLTRLRDQIANMHRDVAEGGEGYEKAIKRYTGIVDTIDLQQQKIRELAATIETQHMEICRLARNGDLLRCEIRDLENAMGADQ